MPRVQLSKAQVFMLCLIPLFALRVRTSAAQALEAGFGWYSGINTSQTLSDWSTERKAAYTFALHSNSFLDGATRARFGVALGFVGARSRPRISNNANDALRDGSEYRLTLLSLSYQRKLNNHESAIWILHCAAGLALRSSKLASGYNACDSPFCNVPEVRWSLAPGMSYLVPFSSHLGAQILARYHLLLGENQNYYPFTSGLFLSIGLVLEQSRNNNQGL